MCLRQWCAQVLCLAAFGLGGCYQPTEGQSDEQKNEYFVVGKERIAARDYKGAIDAFEKAIELRPRSPLTHYEVAMLYDQHSAQKESDYICAMYHYLQAIKLRPNEYPAGNARQRLNACKQELFKNETFSLTAQDIMRERERFKEENLLLRAQLEALKVQLTNRPPLDAQVAGRGTPTTGVTRVVGVPGPPGGRAQTPAGPRTHTVKARETMSSISRLYNVKLSSLEAANPNVDARRLKIGQSIVIPGT